MIEFAQWCTVFCEGNEASGDITIEFEPMPVSLPICDGCLKILRENPARALELAPGEVLELDPEDEALGLIPPK